MSKDKDDTPLTDLKDIKYYCKCGAGKFKDETQLEKHILVKHHAPTKEKT